MEHDAVAAARIRPTKEQVEDELLALDGVVGVDIGEKISDGKPTGEMSIVVYVEKKVAPSKVARSQKVPAELDGIPTDVQELVIELQGGPGLYAGDPLSDTSKHTTIRGGISIGPSRHQNSVARIACHFYEHSTLLPSTRSPGRRSLSRSSLLNCIPLLGRITTGSGRM